MLLNKKEIKILGEFASDYHKGIYGREVAKGLGMNQKTVANILNQLEGEDVLKSDFEGRNKRYYLNRFNLRIKEILKMIEINRKIVFLDEHLMMKELFNKLEERVSGVLVVFGSYASGKEGKGSDLDAFVTGKVRGIDELEELWKIKINVVKSTKGKFDKNEYFIREIIKNHIVLKGVEDFIELAW